MCCVIIAEILIVRSTWTIFAATLNRAVFYIDIYH